MNGYVATLIIVALVIGLIVFILYKINKVVKSVTHAAETDNFWGRLIISIGQAIEQKTAADKAPKVLTIAEKKRNIIENIGLKTFYYLDQDQIELLYPQISNELVLSTVTVTEASEKNRSLNASLQGTIGAETGKSSSTETVSSFNVSDSIIRKYNSIQKFFIEKNSFVFGIEEFDFDEQALSNFKRDCGIMETMYEYKISDADQETHWKHINKKKAYQYLSTIKTISGYIVIQSEFLVKEISEDHYILNYSHVINKFLDKEDGLIIEIICNKKHLTSSALQNFKTDKFIQITLIGKIIRWDKSINILEINPIAIY